MTKYTIDITEVLQKGTGEEVDFSLPLKVETHEKIKFPRGSRLDGSISHIGEHLLINFTINTCQLSQACVRCLTEIDQITSIGPVLESYSLTNAEENDFPLQSQDPETHQQVLDITPLIVQELELLADKDILCKEDCKGLCQYCGKNRNKKQCDCESKAKPTHTSQPLRDLFQPKA